MDIRSERIPEDRYAEFITEMPEACVDIVVEQDGAVLLGRRTIAPAEGEWFWPGTRVFKGEPLAETARRVATEELGIDIHLRHQLGANAHFWETGAQGVPRHTVVVVYHATPAGGVVDLDPDRDDQHDAFRWVEGPDPALHEYVNRYFERFELPRHEG